MFSFLSKAMGLIRPFAFPTVLDWLSLEGWSMVKRHVDCDSAPLLWQKPYHWNN
jgi:hypothetical protein